MQNLKHLNNGLIIRPMEIGDNNEIISLHQKYYEDDFRCPDFNSSIIDAVVTNSDGKVIAVSMIKPISELVMMMDLDQPRRIKAQMLIELLKFASLAEGLQNLELHAFIKDPDFSKLLKKHFGFKACNGEALIHG